MSITYTPKSDIIKAYAEERDIPLKDLSSADAAANAEAAREEAIEREFIGSIIDETIERLGFRYRKDIINTPELRLSRALHITHTDLFIAEEIGMGDPEPLRAVRVKLKALAELIANYKPSKEI